MLGPGRMTVQLYERDPETLESTERGNAEVGVLAVIVSHGDDYVEVDWDEDRNSWEITVVGKSTTWHSR